LEAGQSTEQDFLFAEFRCDVLRKQRQGVIGDDFNFGRHGAKPPQKALLEEKRHGLDDLEGANGGANRRALICLVRDFDFYFGEVTIERPARGQNERDDLTVVRLRLGRQ
jgi:hypothetical protein